MRKIKTVTTERNIEEVTCDVCKKVIRHGTLYQNAVKCQGCKCDMCKDCRVEYDADYWHTGHITGICGGCDYPDFICKRCAKILSKYDDKVRELVDELDDLASDWIKECNH